MKTLYVYKSLPVLALTVLLGACQSYREVDQAAAQAKLPLTPPDFELDGRLQASAPVARWWEQLQDARLEALIDHALADNRDLAQAEAALSESRALLGQARAELLPTVDAKLGTQRDRMPQAVNPLRPGALLQTYDAGLDVAWEADLFAGRLGAAVKAGRATLAERAAALHAAQVSIAAETASAYIALRGSQYQLAVARRNAEVQRQTFELTQTLLDVGQGNRFDLTRAGAQLALTEARIPVLQAELDVALNRLGVLTGQGSDALRELLDEAAVLPSLPGSVGVGDVQTLLQRRPDIQQREAALRSATAQYNIAVADLYPRIVFNGGLGFLSTDWSTLGSDDTEVFTFAPSLQWGGLNWQRAQARIDAADARTQSELAAFEQQVLLALEETDNALHRFSAEEQRRLKLLEAARLGNNAAAIARESFEVGSSDFLGVLDAERSQLEVEAQLAQSETQLLLNLIAVYRTLGGGWTVAR